jgi:hypothetical protein
MPPAGINGIRQPALAHPFLEHGAHAALLRQDRNERDVPEFFREIGQVERQSRSGDDGVRPALAGLHYELGVIRERAHHVHRDEPAWRDLVRAADLAIQRLDIGGAVYFRIVAFAQTFHDVRVQASQVHAGNGADRAFPGDGAGQPVAGNAHAHAALNDGQQFTAPDREQRERGADHEEMGLKETKLA